MSRHVKVDGGIVRSHVGLLVAVVVMVATVLSQGAAAQAFQTIDHPSAGPGGSTLFAGISNGRAVGTWSNAAGTAGGAFIYSGGVFTPLAHPNAVSTSPFAISGNNVAGYFTPAGADTRTRGFLYDGVTWTDFDYPTTPPAAAAETYPLGIGADGTVVGFYDTGGAGRGFLRSPAGTFTTLQFPGSSDTELRDVASGGGRAIGNYIAGGSNAHGFVYDNGVFTTLNYPGAVETDLFGMDGNLIVGVHFDAKSHGLLYDGTTWTNFDAPGATTGTSITGIDGTTLVGSYGDATGTHAFIATVPEPSAVFGLLFAGAAVTLNRRRCRQETSRPPAAGQTFRTLGAEKHGL